MGIGKQIGILCKEGGISLRQLALKADIPYSTLYSAVKRDSNGIDSEILKRIAVALGVDLVDLFMSDDDFAELLPSESEINGYLSGLVAQNKINVFKQAAYLAGYEIDLSKEPYSMKLVPKPEFTHEEGEVIAADLTNQEVANAVNQLISYAGTLCLKMTDVYKRYKDLVGEAAANKAISQGESAMYSTAPSASQDDCRQPAGALDDKDPAGE